MQIVPSVIVCTSMHHGNTRKVAEAMAEAVGGTVLQPAEAGKKPFEDGVLLGFGSGIYFGRHHKSILSLAAELPEASGRRAFIFSTSGMGYRPALVFGKDYHRALRDILVRKGFLITGEYSCKGYDTYGIWGKLGGIARGRPSERDLANAGQFALGLMQMDACGEPNDGQDGGRRNGR